MEYSGITLTPGFIISAATDPQFNYVTALLHGDGTNTGQNNTFLDSSPNNFTVTRGGTPTQGTFTPFGTLWSAFNPNSNNGIGVATNAALNMGTGDFTVEAWVNTSQLPTSNTFTTSPGGYQNIFGTGPNQSATGTGLYIGVTNLIFGITSDTSGPIDVAHNMVAGQWYHVAITRSGTTFRAFINGSLVQTGTSAASWNDGYGYGIMRSEPIGGYDGAFWYGYVSNFRLVKGGALYTTSFTPSTAPLTTTVSVGTVSLLLCQSNRFTDNSVNAFTVLVNNTPSIQRYSPFGTTIGYQPAVIGGSGLFGVADYLQLPTTSAFQFGTNNFTIECWVYLNSAVTAAQRTIWYNYVSSFTTDSIFFGGHASYGGRITFWAFNVNNSAPVLLDPTALTPYVWTHIAVVRSGTSFNLYRNGVSVSNATSSASVVGPTWTTGGYIGTSGTSSLDGYISDFRMVNGTAVYTANFTPPTIPLPSIGNTSLLLSGTNGQVFDNAMMNNLVTVGNAQISTSVVKYGTGSIFFNGTGSYLSTPSSPNLSFGTGDFTIEGWVYLSSATGAYRTIVSIPHSSGELLVRFGNSAAYNSYFQVSVLGTLTSNVYSTNQTQTALLNQWVHFAFTRSSSTCRVFLNGVLQNIGTGAPATVFSATSFSDSTNITSSGTVGIGESIGNNIPFIGYMDELRITKGIARYTSNFLPPPSIFPSTGNISVITPTVEYLMVAGGGAGGTVRGGGGGAGGVLNSTANVTAGVAYVITIGAGATSTTSPGAPVRGDNSTITGGLTLTAIGGGGGGSEDQAVSANQNGGSGGGGCGSLANPGGSATAGQGSVGGNAVYSPPNYGAGGGGGFSAAGGNGTSTTAGNGGAGLASSISGSSVTYAGGGGGGTYNGGTPGTGGAGGGGAGGGTNAGTANTGGGGGGGAGPAGRGGNGGSGIVIIRYTTTFSLATSTTGNPTVTTTGGYNTYTWTSSGSITF